MKKNIYFYFLILASLFLILTSKIHAAPRFPIAQLDNCRNVRECKLFCEIPANTPVCWSYNRYILQSNVLGTTTITDEVAAAKNNVNFPVAELGDCATPLECREFCALEENKTTCTDFAIKKNLQTTRVKEIKSTVLQKARTELGCDSKTSCHNYCRKPENQELCKSFGEKYELIKKSVSGSGVVDPQIFTKAGSELGCSTETSCKNLCNNPDNTKKCRAFAAKYGMGKLSGTQKSVIAKELIGSGLCKNEVECASYCQKNPDACPGFNEGTGSGVLNDKTNSYLGPNGCRTEKECMEYCKTNPNKCPGFPKKVSNFEELPKTTTVRSTPPKTNPSQALVEEE